MFFQRKLPDWNDELLHYNVIQVNVRVSHRSIIRQTDHSRYIPYRDKRYAVKSVLNFILMPPHKTESFSRLLPQLFSARDQRMLRNARRLSLLCGKRRFGAFFWRIVSRLFNYLQWIA